MVSAIASRRAQRRLIRSVACVIQFIPCDRPTMLVHPVEFAVRAPPVPQRPPEPILNGRSSVQAQESLNVRSRVDERVERQIVRFVPNELLMRLGSQVIGEIAVLRIAYLAVTTQYGFLQRLLIVLYTFHLENDVAGGIARRDSSFRYLQTVSDAPSSSFWPSHSSQHSRGRRTSHGPSYKMRACQRVRRSSERARCQAFCRWASHPAPRVQISRTVI